VAEQLTAVALYERFEGPFVACVREREESGVALGREEPD
jgi:hypothetical protein